MATQGQGVTDMHPQDLGALITLTTQGAGTINSADQTIPGARGLKAVINLTSLGGGAPTVQITIQGKDPASGVYYTILQSLALAAVASTVLTVLPGLTAAANLVASDGLPAVWRIQAVVVAATGNITATIGVSTLK